jgi:hypothetical protein
MSGTTFGFSGTAGWVGAFLHQECTTLTRTDARRVTTSCSQENTPRVRIPGPRPRPRAACGYPATTAHKSRTPEPWSCVSAHPLR